MSFLPEASFLRGLTPHALVVGAADGKVAYVPAVAAGSALVSAGPAAPPVYTDSPSLANLTLSARLSAPHVQPATPAGVGVTGTNLDLIAGQGSPGNGGTRGGLGADAHLRAGDGGTDGGGGLGFGGSLSVDCGLGAANGAEPHLSIGTVRAVTLTVGRTAAGLSLIGTLIATGQWSHTGSSYGSVTSGAYNVTAGASSSQLVTGNNNNQSSGNNQWTSTGGSLDLVANSYRLFTAGITLGSTITPSSSGLAFTNNIALGGVAPGTTANGVLSLGRGATAPTTSVDVAQLFGRDIAAGRATLALVTEEAVNGDVGIVSTHSGIIFWNGATYKIGLTLVP